MTHFEDGPAQGQTLMLKRSPRFLRVVRAGRTWDALDQLEDRAEPNETIYVYERVGEPGRVHLNCGRGGGTFSMASYRFFSHQPPEADMRDNEAWQRWCGLQKKELEP